jgi:hypothetical protein
MHAKVFVPFLKMNNVQYICIDIEKREIEINIWRMDEQAYGNCCCNKT